MVNRLGFVTFIAIAVACTDQGPQSVGGAWVAATSVSTHTIALTQSDTLVTGTGDYANHVMRTNATIVITGSYRPPTVVLHFIYLGADSSYYRASYVHGAQMSGIETFTGGSTDTLVFSRQ